ncbi:IS3 family transposase [Nocardia arizonensis]|uniref:IS3 family transposase n=1 Tax=Nocardia arizonensis TaxID=1141647 RepID=UPI001EF52102|nr:IS3 family transposase [Nocardia arizonensis]
MENFFSTLKTELVYRNSWRSREEAQNALFAHIDGWNSFEVTQRRQWPLSSMHLRNA